MKKYTIVILLLTVTPTVFGQIATDSIKAIIKREVAHKRSKSIIVGIVNANGRQIFAEGKKSDKDATLPDGTTIYEIGSITKVFTSLALADMSLKQQLSLTDPISKFLPTTVKIPVRNGKEITLLSLSTHRSGMPRFPYNVDPKNLDEPYADYTVSKLYEYVSHFEPTFDIDSKWRYSNVAYGLLGNILTLVAQKDFEALITAEICKPLHMNNTVISLTANQKSNLAVGHAETGTVVGLTDLGAIGPGGSIRSNVNDLLTFAEANMGVIKTNLSPAMELTHVMQAKKDGNDTFITMCWTLVENNGQHLLFKDGGMPGYSTFLGIDKKIKLASLFYPIPTIQYQILAGIFLMLLIKLHLINIHGHYWILSEQRIKPREQTPLLSYTNNLKLQKRHHLFLMKVNLII
ncbi:serine hydrolase domain-containing protein [Flavobacterium sp.]|uniref:serine hydrolase domain-containing protein n=1 Tax=Flavobacterium sp. TaxID=239 RepID=UPI003D0EACD5